MKSFAVLVVAVSLAVAAQGQHQTFSIDPDSSAIKMKLNTTREVVNGAFHVRSGSIDFDRTASRFSGIILVSAGSGKTGNGSRDKRMNKDILKVTQFADVSFAPKTYTGSLATSGDSIIQVSGVFTLLGTPHDLSILMQIHIDGSQATAKGQFVIPYVSWGLKDPSFLSWKAENNVEIVLDLAGQITN
jgi:hypothetical protein